MHQTTPEISQEKKLKKNRKRNGSVENEMKKENEQLMI